MLKLAGRRPAMKQTHCLDMLEKSPKKNKKTKRDSSVDALRLPYRQQTFPVPPPHPMHMHTHMQTQPCNAVRAKALYHRQIQVLLMTQLRL